MQMIERSFDEFHYEIPLGTDLTYVPHVIYKLEND